MEHFLNLLAIMFISFGAFFLLVGSVGLIRLPDFYSRTHATGKSDTLGIMLVLTGLILTQIDSVAFLTKTNWVNIFKLLLIFAFVGITNPTATNALSRAAYRFRLKPWFKGDKSKKEETE